VSRYALAVLAVVVLATGLRVGGLGRWPFAGDELGTFDELGWWTHPPAVAENPDQTVPKVIPLSMAVFDAGRRLFGASELGSRVVPCVSGVLGVLAVTLGLAGVLPRWQAIAVGLWLAVGVEPIFYSQYHRFYTLTALFAWPALVTGARAVKADSAGWMLLACALAGLATACHTLAGATFGTLAVASLWGGRRVRLTAWGGAIVAAGVAGAVILPVVRAKAGMTTWAGDSPLRAAFSLVAQASWPACVLAPVGLMALWKRDRRQAGYWGTTAVAWVGGGLVLPVVLPYHSAYSFAAALPVWVLAGVATAELASTAGGRLLWAGLPLLTLPSLASYYADGNRHDFRAVADYIAVRAGPDDRVLCNEPDKLRHYRPELLPRLLPPLAADPFAVPPNGRLWVACGANRRSLEKPWAGWLAAHARLQTVIAARRADYHEYAVWVYVTDGPR
jgi:hypothetical protein